MFHFEKLCFNPVQYLLTQLLVISHHLSITHLLIIIPTQPPRYPNTPSLTWPLLPNPGDNSPLPSVCLQGIFWHITFELPLFVGGIHGVNADRDRLGVTTGYRGCIRLLEINDHSLDFRPAPTGDVLQGWDIGQ